MHHTKVKVLQKKHINNKKITFMHANMLTKGHCSIYAKALGVSHSNPSLRIRPSESVCHRKGDISTTMYDRDDSWAPR